MKSFLTFIAFLSTVFVYGQESQPKDTIPFFYIDDTENYVYFPGGDSAFHSYLSANIVYPDSAWKNGIQGIVYVQFSIDTSGIISDVKIIKGLTPDIDAHVAQVISNMPTWEWIIKKRRKCTKTIPIKFTAK